MVHIVVYDADLAKCFAGNRIFGKPTRWKPKLIHIRSRLVMKHKMISFSNTCIAFSMSIRAEVWKQSCVWVLTLSLLSPVWHFSNLYLTRFQCNFYSTLQDVRCNANKTNRTNSIFDQNVSCLTFAALKYPRPQICPRLYMYTLLSSWTYPCIHL